LTTRENDYIPEIHHIDKRAHQLLRRSVGNPDDLLSTSEVAEWFGMSTSWLEIARVRGFGPPWVALTPRRIRYKRSSVLQWLEERQQISLDKLIEKRRHKRIRLNDSKEAAE
jgi:predicted DNA-binding transcriptional regulator AlpA